MLSRTLRRTARALGLDVRRYRSTNGDPTTTLYDELYSAETLARKPFYNVGAGKFRHPHWTNVDHPSAWYAEHQRDQALLAHDLMSGEPLPIDADSAELIFTSHTMEHVTDEAAAHFFGEAHRTLRPGGILRVTVPDADLFYRALLRRDRRFDNLPRIYDTPEKARAICMDRPASEFSCQQLFLWRIASSVSVHHLDGSPQRMTDEALDEALATLPLDQVLDGCTSKCDLEVQRRHPGNHINWWNAEKLTAMLEAAGFGEVYHSGYGQSASPLLRDTQYFDCTNPWMSVYVEAVK